MRVPIAQQHYPTRRFLLRSAGGALLLPVFPRVIWSPVSILGVEMPLNSIAARFVSQGCYPPFSAQAAVPWLALSRIVGAAGALTLILSYFGVRPSWGRTVDLHQAGGCENNFRNAEAAMRRRGFTEFGGVYRPGIEPRYAMLLAKTESGSGEAATQFQGADALNVNDQEPDVLAAAGDFVSARYQLQGQDLARFLALTRKEEILASDRARNTQVPVRVFHNAADSFVLFDRRPFPPATAGRVAVYVKGRTNRGALPVIGLVA